MCTVNLAKSFNMTKCGSHTLEGWIKTPSEIFVNIKKINKSLKVFLS